LVAEGLREEERQSFESMDGVRRINDLVNKGEAFEAIWRNPTLQVRKTSSFEPVYAKNAFLPRPARDNIGKAPKTRMRFSQALVASVLTEPFRLHSLNGHDPLPGRGHQALHADWRPAAFDSDGQQPQVTPESGYGVVNSIWMLGAKETR
jgi:hypothetical protein